MLPIARRQLKIGTGAVLIACVCSLRLPGAINPSEVLVVYNSQSSGATTVKNSYMAAHPSIPADNVFNLNNASIAGVADVTYADFISKIRNPIRTYLDLAGGPSATSIISIVLIRGIPHRILDTDNAAVGDNPSGLGAEFFPAADATCASVDSELTLLWQDLELGTTGFPEAGGTMDSKSDNLIDNPYHMSSTSIQSFSRANIKATKTLDNISNVAWRSTTVGSSSIKLTPGDMYLVCRIDGTTVADAQAIISRGANLLVNKKYARIILDEDARANHLDDDDLFAPPNDNFFNAGPDYENTRDAMTPLGWHVRYDNTSNFIESFEETRPIILYASYGENHSVNPPGSGTYIDAFNFPNGAMFNTFESYNGRAFNGLTTILTQEQVADFITAGGTFGIGNVWEPFTFSIADNRYLAVNFLVNGMTWAEAAWSALPALSWMQIAVGDPLARVVTVVNQIADFDADGDVDSDDFDYFKLCATRASVPQTNPNCADAHLDGDSDVDMSDFAKFQKCFSGAGVIGNPACAP